MNEFKEKLGRIKPVIRAKKALFDQETQRLQQIKQKKLQAMELLNTEQENYMKSVEILNQTRQSGDFSSLQTLEDGIEFVKSKWVQNLREVRDFEAREEAQMGHVLSLQKQLKSVEKLAEIYEEGADSIREEKLRKELEEFALQEFNRR